MQVPDSKLKYQQLLQYAKQLPPLPADMHTEEHKVRGCVSQVQIGCFFPLNTRMYASGMSGAQVWVVPTLKPDGAVYWAADSDSALTKVCCHAALSLIQSLLRMSCKCPGGGLVLRSGICRAWQRCWCKA